MAYGGNCAVAGSLVGYGSDAYSSNIFIAGPVVSDSYIRLWAADGIYIDDYITSGAYIDLQSYGVDTIDITGDVTSGTEMSMYSAGSI